MTQYSRLLPLVVALAALAMTTFVGAQDAPPATDFKSGGNTWGASNVGDWVLYQLKEGPGVRFEVTAIAENGDITFQHTIYNPQGEVVADNARTRTPGDAPVQQRVPRDKDVQWSEDTYLMEGLELAALTGKWTSEESVTEVWFSDKVPCGGVLKTATDGTDSVWLKGFTRDGKEYKLGAAVEPQPEPQPQPQPEPTPEPQPEETAREPLPDFGDPITMKLPEKVAKAMKDQGLAITRMRVYFDENSGDQGAVLEYEGMRTEVPVIYAAFNGEECDLELSYKEWQRRDGRYVDLGFDVKTLPARLKNLEVQIVHSHLQGEDETQLATYEVVVPEAGERWDALRLRGALPGINRYALQVSYTNADGAKTTHKGFSHWVVVQSPPMFEFSNDVSATGTRLDAGTNTILEGDIGMTGSFTLHHGIKAEDCTLRITREGRRDMNLDDLPAEVRRVIAKEKIPPGWQEVARVDFADGEVNGRRVVTVEDSRIRIEWGHAFAASSKVLPVTEDWEYRFELLHSDSALPLATWSVSIGLGISRPDDINTAAMKVRATGLDETLNVAFKRR
ncbi:MAG: hypothetical protein K8I27_06885 [Planctomycetes bacterium]|nr:hypothetical protein [Planctomycetota bacterium]